MSNGNGKKCIMKTVQECCGGKGYVFTGKQNVTCLDSSLTACATAGFIGNASINISYAMYDSDAQTCNCSYTLQICPPPRSSVRCTSNITSTCCPYSDYYTASCSEDDKSLCSSSSAKFNLTCHGSLNNRICPGNYSFASLINGTLISASTEFDWWYNMSSNDIGYYCYCNYQYLNCTTTKAPTKKPTTTTTQTPTRMPTQFPTSTPTTRSPTTKIFLPTLAPTPNPTAAFAKFDANLTIICQANLLIENICLYSSWDEVFDKIFENAANLTIEKVGCNNVTGTANFSVEFQIYAQWKNSTQFAKDEAKLQRLAAEIIAYGPDGIISVNDHVNYFDCANCYQLNFAVNNHTPTTITIITIFVSLFIIFITII